MVMSLSAAVGVDAATSTHLTAPCANPLLPSFITRAGSREPTFRKTLDSTLMVAPGQRVRLAVARSAVDQEVGLMCVFHLEPTSGMLFVFSGDQNRFFWMKNTYVPLDLLWLTEDGIVTRIAANVPATPPGASDDLVARRHGSGHYVIEMLAGTAAAYGIVPGTRLQFFPKP